MVQCTTCTKTNTEIRAVIVVLVEETVVVDEAVVEETRVVDVLVEVVDKVGWAVKVPAKAAKAKKALARL